MKQCKVEGCGVLVGKSGRRGMCSSHYRALLKTGVPRLRKPVVSVCSIPGCERKGFSRTVCACHYNKFTDRGWQGPEVPGRLHRSDHPVCSQDGCSRFVRSKGLCNPHYLRTRIHGSPGGPSKPIRPKHAHGHRRISSHGYVLVTVPGGTRHEHRLVMEQHLGRSLEPYETVHHINGVRDDNRLENLELWCSRHPKGQRVRDLVAWAREILERYENENLPQGWEHAGVPKRDREAS